ncbi:MAG: ATP-binding cassette domain-containing protein, partial [Calditrichaeota bacterium]|nr:ATP-binding cassette domain-containing protein [Calditrichota bacterium]
GFQSESIAKQISIVTQESFLFSDTIKNNIRFSSLDATDAEINNAIEKAQLKETIDNLPAGADTLLGERGINLSGGQKQRTAIARALLKQSQILILDDCLSAVDTQTEEAILETIKKESSDKTTIIISHRISSLMHADQIIVLDDGEIIEQGNHQQLCAIGGHYADMYEKQLIEAELNELL